MNKMKFWAFALAFTASAFAMQSCDINDDDNYSTVLPNALVTVKPDANNSSFYMQLDDSTTLSATNMKTSPFGTKEVRALVNYEYVKNESSIYSHAVRINWIDSIRTKTTAPDMGVDNIKVYGDDPVEIVNDWVTIAEDGYLTLRFRTYWGQQKVHYVNLVAGTDANDPYKVVFYHNANGENGGYVSDGLIAFKLDKLPDTNGKTVDLTLEWKSFSGTKSVKFKYCTRKSVNPINNIANGKFINRIK